MNEDNAMISQTSTTPPMEKPNNFLAWAILSTIFCCVPFGICSIVFAAKVDCLWYAGNYSEANDAARKARTWFWWAFGTGLAGIILYLIFVVVVAFAIEYPEY